MPYFRTTRRFAPGGRLGHDRIAVAASRFSTAAKGYDCAFCDKSTKIGTLVVLYI